MLAVDWDLESPGLHRFFHPFLDDSTVGATPGVIDLITEYASRPSTPVPRSDDWYLDYARVQPHAVSLELGFPGGGTLDFLSAGRQNREYSSAVSSLTGTTSTTGSAAASSSALRDDMKPHYDYVLIDSRTGLSDIADICTVELPDVLIDCFTLSDQCIDGAAAVARQISGRYRDRGIRVLPVPMRIDDGEKEKLDTGRALARLRFDRFPGGLSQESSARTGPRWRSRTGRTTRTRRSWPPSATSPALASLLSAFERITAAVTEGEITAMPPSARIPAAAQGAFTRRQPPPPTSSSATSPRTGCGPTGSSPC